MDKKPSDQRRLKRWHLIYYLRVFDREKNELLGHLVDINTKGIMIISENPIETQKNYKFKMDLPRAIGGRTDVSFEAQSLWCKTDINTDFYDTGFKFTNVALKDVSLIEHLIHDLSFSK